MKHIGFVIALILVLACTGCSKLTRREATNQIDAMMKPHPTGAGKAVNPAGGYVPGFSLSANDRFQMLGVYISFGRTDQSNALETALVKMGYVTVKDGGPGLIDNGAIGRDGYLPQYRHADSTHIVSLTEKAGNPTVSTLGVTYPVGFMCYDAPNPTQCDLPPFIERVDKGYQITGITQDEVHAKVNITIPWKLTPFAIELKPYAAALDTSKPDYTMAEWAKYLNAHASSGGSPATILFQKFDDGWRIVDEQGRSEKDLN